MTLSSFPEFILPGKTFEIKGTGSPRAYINKVDRILGLPLHTPEEAVQVNKHELGHAKWSPDTHPQMSDPVFQACEDARVNLALQGLGIPFKSVVRPKIPKDPRNQVLMAVAVLGTSLEEQYNPPIHLQYIVDNVKKLLLASAEYSEVVHADITDTEAACEYIHKEFETAKEKTKEKRLKQVKKIKEAGYTVTSALKIKKLKRGKTPEKPPETTPEPTPEEKELEDEILAEVEVEFSEDLKPQSAIPPTDVPEKSRRREVHPSRPSLGEKDPDKCSGKMSIVKHTLPKEGCKYRRNTYTSEGSVLTAPHRMPIDGAIFRRRKRHFLEGTVVIDVSGSMRLDKKHIEEIILASSGHTTVAIYSGTCYKGHLHIVAARGKMVEEMPDTAYANVIDYPVLTWLGKQHGKKFWVCDNGVTGIADIPYLSIRKACAALEKKHNIKRFGNMRAFMKFAKRLR